MKISTFVLLSAAPWVFTGCNAAPEVAVAPAPTMAPKTAPAPVVASTLAPITPVATPQVVRSTRSSLPPLPQANNAPRPPYVPIPTPKVRPGDTIIISNAPTMAPPPARLESPTIIISNTPIPGTDITPQVAAARDLVWVNTKSGIFHRPGSRFYGGTTDGFYSTQARAQASGYRAALR